ncbi:tyrosine-type recombinase/integrase [Roseiflexus sp.]|uniref:tyrosine-type recombinase/integrase n=1 Tax=Roseiflexus sp. TaxID=2562120 RepID=UPI00258F3029|nr:tyrosine-type recombinase/integrase [Roseiflexus sp.]
MLSKAIILHGKNHCQGRAILSAKKRADRRRPAIRLRGSSIRTEQAYLHRYEHGHARRARHSTDVQPHLRHDAGGRILAHLDGAPYLVACLLYGSGLRLLAALRRRIQDRDGAHVLITVRDTQSNRDRIPCLPNEERFLPCLHARLAQVRRRSESHPAFPVSMLPALAHTYPAAVTSWERHDVFPARDLSVDPRTLAVSGSQRAITGAVRAAGITTRATAHTLRAAFAHQRNDAGYRTDDLQQRMDHADIRTTRHSLKGQPPAA